MADLRDIIYMYINSEANLDYIYTQIFTIQILKLLLK